MTLVGKREEKSTAEKKSGKVKVSLIAAGETGLTYKPGQSGEVKMPYPLIVGEMVVYSIGPDPLQVEFIKEGKFYYFVFYDHRLGMVAKSRIQPYHANYVLRELISRRGNIPTGGLINVDKLNEIFQTGRLEKFI
jgi:hypothetical protein